jgi:hypothetical protein
VIAATSPKGTLSQGNFCGMGFLYAWPVFGGIRLASEGLEKLVARYLPKDGAA